MRLLVVSDTFMKQDEGGVYGYAPVVKELQSIQHLFEKITWIGMADPSQIQNAVLKCELKFMQCIVLPKLGGTKFNDKLKVLFYLPFTIFILLREIQKNDVVHTRGPCLPAYLALWMSWFFRNKIWWNKYATNWVSTNASFAFKLHRYLLVKSTFSKVTVNGNWPGLPKHIFNFENPCISADQILKGRSVTSEKKFTKPFNLIFIGNLEKQKGIDILFNSINDVDDKLWNRLDIVGFGPQFETIRNWAMLFPEKVFVHGSITSNNVHELLQKAHFLLLPSLSEGFPKVIAEACCWGCIPITSSVGSIPFYIDHESNGFLWDIDGASDFASTLKSVFDIDESSLEDISRKSYMLAHRFTFNSYSVRISDEILRW